MLSRTGVLVVGVTSVVRERGRERVRERERESLRVSPSVLGVQRVSSTSNVARVATSVRDVPLGGPGHPLL
jgi:hypothetical protein